MAFSASRPVRAASAMEAMPVTSSEKTRGMIVIRRAFSHSWPRAAMKSAVPAPPGRPQRCAAAPAARPRASANNTWALSDARKDRAVFMTATLAALAKRASRS